MRSRIGLVWYKLLQNISHSFSWEDFEFLLSVKRLYEKWEVVKNGTWLVEGNVESEEDESFLGV